MTEGIIQKLFKKYHTNEICIDGEELQELEQELIEKIKQADTKNPDWDYKFSIGVRLMKIYLIGDNQ